MGMLQEFKQFAVRGNVVDLAVGIIIGGAFGNIVSSLVGDVIMPLVGALTGGTNFTDWFLWLGDAPRPATLAEAKERGGAFIGWGSFLQNTLDFVIVAFAVFLLVKAINTARAQLERKPEVEAPAPPEDILLLREIRDALKRA